MSGGGGGGGSARGCGCGPIVAMTPVHRGLVVKQALAWREGRGRGQHFGVEQEHGCCGSRAVRQFLRCSQNAAGHRPGLLGPTLLGRAFVSRAPVNSLANI